MADNISKLCSDFLREIYPGLKASHAHELVAAFFGYKSHAALLAESKYKADQVEDADLLIPDIALIDERRGCLNGLPTNVSGGRWLAEELSRYLQENELFFGDIWILDSDLATHIIDLFLPENVDGELDNYLADIIAGTNAFFDWPDYEKATVENGLDSVKILVSGTYSGEHDFENDRMFAGDTIDMEIVVELGRVAGRVAFAKPEVDVSGEVQAWHDDYDDEPAA